MKSTLKAIAFVFLLGIAFSCEKEEPVPPFVTNNSVEPQDFLSEKNYDVINVEVAYVEGYQPLAASLNNLSQFLKDRLNKSGGVTITQHTIPASGRLTVDVNQIRELEKSHRETVTSGNVLTFYVTFLDAEYSQSTESQKVLGLAYGASSIAVFEKSVYTYTPPGVGARRILESLILTHETSHILGLVNSGVPMVAPHHDSDHGAHCSNTECLMYWKSEASVDLDEVLNNTIPQLDANCLADLKAAGGK